MRRRKHFMKRKFITLIVISLLALTGCGEQEQPALKPVEKKTLEDFNDYDVRIASLIMAAGTQEGISFMRDDGMLTSYAGDISVTSKDESILKIEMGKAGFLLSAQKAGSTKIVVDYRGIVKEKEITVVETDSSFFFASDENGNPIKNIKVGELENAEIYMTVKDMLQGEPLHQYGMISYSDIFMQADDFRILTDSDELKSNGEQFTVVRAETFNSVAAPNGTITVLLVDKNDRTKVYGMAEWYVN